MTRTWIAALAAAGCMACTQPTPEQQIVNDAAAALGGRERVAAVKTLVIEGEGTYGNPGQDMTPEATGQTFTATGYRRAIDVAGGRARVEQTRTPNFEYFQGRAPQKQVQGIDGQVGYKVLPNGTTPPAPPNVAKDRRAEIYHHPITMVRAALDPAAKLENARNLAGESAVAVTTADGLAFTLAIDGATKLPSRVVSMTDNTVLGDVAIETTFADYQDVDGLKLPARLTTKMDTLTTADIRVTRQAVDADVGDLAAPPAATTAAKTAVPPQPNVVVEEVAKGVWLMGGQTHHSVVVEFDDHLMLIEAPNEARTLAVIAKARELRRGKPVTQVVNSHHHFDHSGGIRAAISEGLTVITHKANAKFFEDLAARSRTIAPDALAKNPKPLKLETVDDELILKDGTREVRLYHIAGNPHGDAMLMAYLPRERLLVEVDAFSPGAQAQPYAANLLENVKRRNLRVDRIVPLHGAIAPFSDLVKAVQPSTSD